MAFQNTQLRIKNNHSGGNNAAVDVVLVVSANAAAAADVAAGARVRVDYSGAANVATSYLLQLDRVQSGANAVSAPLAVIAFGEQEDANGKVQFLFDLGGRAGMNVAANSGILTTQVANTAGTPTGSIRIRINGATRYIPFFTTVA